MPSIIFYYDRRFFIYAARWPLSMIMKGMIVTNCEKCQ